MGPFRVVFFASSFLLFSLLLAWSTLRTSSTTHRRVFTSSIDDGHGSRFSFRSPAALFPPSAIITLTDDNSTFFVARHAAYGPELPLDGLSGQIWLGSDFTEDLLGGGHFAESSSGELGCGDALEWDPDDSSPQAFHDPEELFDYESEPAADARTVHSRRDSSSIDSLSRSELRIPRGRKGASLRSQNRVETQRTVSSLSEDVASRKTGGFRAGNIKSLQESAEIEGKIVLLKRGGCGFLDKTRWVQNRGGKALIIGDNVLHASLITMYAKGDVSNITIPSIFTSHTTAHLLASLIADQGGRSNRSSGSNYRENLAGIPMAYREMERTAIQYSKPHTTSREKSRVKDLRTLRDDDNSEGEGIIEIDEEVSSTLDGFAIGVQDWRDPDMIDQDGVNSATSKSNIAHQRESIASQSNLTGPVHHVGLWVTLTPANDGFSPFFDTLLVLIVSPLITLTLVYLIVLIRNRLRRRRWRAPKAIVDRLPVHTFSLHTANSSRSVSLLDLAREAPLEDQRGGTEQAVQARDAPASGDESATAGGAAESPEEAMTESPEEKARTAQRHQGARRFRGRQLECVICLEEYVDGVSQVMRLPCGHEFHQACM